MRAFAQSSAASVLPCGQLARRRAHCIVMLKFIETIQPSIETLNELNVLAKNSPRAVQKPNKKHSIRCSNCLMYLPPELPIFSKRRGRHPTGQERC